MKLQSLHKKLKVPSCEIYDSAMSSLFVVLGVLNMRLAIRLHHLPHAEKNSATNSGNLHPLTTSPRGKGPSA